MKESCFCGRTGEVEERTSVLDANGRRALECPDCGHADYLEWLPEKTSSLVWEEARRRREVLDDEGRPAA